MRKLGLICITAVLALAVMGFGFAKWSDSVVLSHSVSSGEVEVGFCQNSYGSKDVGPDWTNNVSFTNIQYVPESKDVGSTSGTFSDTDNNGTLDLLTVTTTGAYPYYYNEITSKLCVQGTVPVILQYAVLDWMDTEYTIDDGQLYLFLSDGTVIPYAGTIPENAVIEFCWMNNAGNQFHPGQFAEESYDFMVLQPAAQNTTYTFGISVEGVQWNESAI